MYRLGVFAFLLAPFVVAASQKSVPPVINISIYAPVQKDAPLHIVNLHYDAFSVQFVLSNISDKSVVNAKIGSVFVAPDGCGADPNRLLVLGGVGIGADNVDELRISPHESAVTFPRDHGDISPVLPPSILVRNAQRLATAYVHVQVGVVEVDFADGTKWKLQGGMPKTLFDPSLANADDGKCPDASAAIESLRVIDGVKFDGRDDEDSGGDPPHLHFSCSLEDSKAICPRGADRPNRARLVESHF